MKELYDDLEELCEITARELGEATDKIRTAGGKVSAGDMDVLDKLTHTIKSIKTTMAMMDAEDGESEAYRRARSYNDGAYARRRDSMGRYSRRAYEDEMMRR